MKWTPEQQSAISHRRGSLLLSAAAGSGKTAVVTQRAVDMIVRDGVDVSRLLLMTFTDAAAAEMRSRISRELAGAGGKARREQLAMLPEADISTMHAYCAKLLRRHYAAVGIDPAFTILGDESGALSAQAARQAVDAGFERGDPDFLLLAKTLGGRGGKNLEKLILDLYEQLRSRPDYMQSLAAWVEEYGLDEQGIKSCPWMRVMLDDAAARLESALAYICLAETYAEEPGGPAMYLDVLKRDADTLRDLAEACGSGYDALCNALGGVSFDRLSGRGECDAALKERVKDLRDKAKGIVKKLAGSKAFSGLANIRRAHTAMLPAMRALYGVMTDFEARYDMLKAKAKALDYSDLLHLALRALSDDDAAAAERARYDYVFVDEYQDTNLLQETLISRISRPDNLFCVGDVKQSIYAFRQAEPEIFTARMQACGHGGGGSMIHLNRNFRSSPAVIDTVNFVFGNIMSRSLGGVDYNSDQRLYPGAPRPETEPEHAKAQLVIIHGEPDDAEDTPVQREAALIGQKIRRMMGGTVFDGKQGTYRPMQYSDICILARSLTPIVRPVRRILEQMDIPVAPVQNEGYFKELEVIQALDILTCIDNRHRDVSLISAMRSPAFSFSMDELLRIRRAYPGRDISFFGAADRYAQQKGDELASRLKAFLETLLDLRDRARFMPLRDFLWHVFDGTSFYDAVGALPGGPHRQANLRLLMDKAHEYSRVPGASLHGYLQYIRSLNESGREISAPAPAGDENAVKLMTIHKSKGLEFPVVFVMSLGKRANTASRNPAMEMYRTLAPGVRHYMPETRKRADTLARAAVRTMADRDVYSEEIRLLYVAMTRAKESLTLVGTFKKDIADEIESFAAPLSPALLADMDGCYLRWLCACAIRNSACGNLRALSASPPPAEAFVPGFSAEFVEAAGIAVDRQARRHAVETAIERALKTPPAAAFDWQYPHPAMVPSKTSATALVKGAAPGRPASPDRVRIPAAGGGFFTAAERGTITHTVLQHLPLAADDAKIAEVIDSLCQRRLLPEGGREAVNVRWIKAFLRSEPAEQARRSPEVRRETPFVVRVPANRVYDTDSDETVLVQGIIDLCYRTEGGWVLIDYKTNRLDTKTDAALILMHYRPQLEIYRYALEKITAIPVIRAGLFLLSRGETVWL